MTDTENIIPKITDPMGKYWDQPSSSDIAIDNSIAVMTNDSFQRLANYSATLPSGTYAGKMWKCQTNNGWLLVWYGIPTGDRIPIHTREIVIS